MVKLGLRPVVPGAAATTPPTMARLRVPRAYKALGYAPIAAHDYDPAVAALSRAVELSPGMVAVHSAIGDARFLEGERPVALAAYAAEPQPYSRLVGTAIVRDRMGDAPAAHAAFDELIREEGDSAAYQQAQVYAQWRQPDPAFAALARARAAGDAGLLNARTDPLLDPLRHDPRMDTLLAGLDLK